MRRPARHRQPRPNLLGPRSAVGLVVMHRSLHGLLLDVTGTTAGRKDVSAPVQLATAQDNVLRASHERNPQVARIVVTRVLRLVLGDGPPEAISFFGDLCAFHGANLRAASSRP